MKFGILMHKNTQNIGDDIQSFAAARLLPQIDYFIDRETIDTFKADEEEPVAVVMSAWYMWHKWNWPPSEYIYPLLISMHYADHKLANQDGSPVNTEFLNGIGGEYLNSFAPVGCRDKYTEQTFKDLGIDAYFSGCITITLPKMPIIKPEHEYVCCVDVCKEVVERTEKLLDGTGIEIKQPRHSTDYRNSTATWEERQKAVTDLLTIYQNAKCVITRRLHCALPCLAMGVPVLLINNERKGAYIRFDPYYDWLYNCTKEAYISGEYDYDITNPPQNKEDYIPYREDILRRIAEFIEKCRDMHGTPEELSPFKHTHDEITFWRHDVMKSCMDDWLYVTRADFHAKSRLNKKVKGLKSDLAGTEEKLDLTKKELLKANGKLDSKEKQIEKDKERISELKKEIAQLKKKNSALKEGNLTLKNENNGMKKILSCRCVTIPVKLRNAFVKKQKKIDLSKYNK